MGRLYPPHGIDAMGKTLRWVIPGSRLLPTHRAARLQSGSPPGRRLTISPCSRTKRLVRTKSQEALASDGYLGTYVPMSHVEVERVQTGVRLEKRLLKVLKAVAELKDMSLGDLLEGIVLHAFEGKSAFTRDTLKEIEQLKAIYGLALTAEDSHNLKERS
jgi:hypothetical protein